MKPKLRILDFHTPAATDDVATALSLVRDALGEEQKRINDEGAKAMQGGDYDTATAVIEFARRLLVFNKKVGGRPVFPSFDRLELPRNVPPPQAIHGGKRRWIGDEIREDSDRQSEAGIFPIALAGNRIIADATFGVGHKCPHVAELLAAENPDLTDIPVFVNAGLAKIPLVIS